MAPQNNQVETFSNVQPLQQETFSNVTPIAGAAPPAESAPPQQSFLQKAATQPSQFSHANPLRYLDELGQGMAQGVQAIRHPIDTAQRMYQSMTDTSRYQQPADTSVGGTLDQLFQGYGQAAVAAPLVKGAGKAYDYLQLTKGPVPRPAPAWKTAQPTPTEIQVQGSTPGEIQAQIQKLAARRANVPRGTQVVNTAPESPQPVALKLPQPKGSDPFSGPRTPAMEPAQSTTISQHGYHPESQTMVVHFKNGNVYEYRGVPPEVYKAYQNSESQGSFFAENIKGRYTTNKLGNAGKSPGSKVKEALGRKPSPKP